MARIRGKTTVRSIIGPNGTAGAQIPILAYSENRARVEFQFGQHSNVYGVSTDGTTGTTMNNDVAVFPITFDYELHGSGVFGPFQGFVTTGFALTIIETMFEEHQPAGEV